MADVSFWNETITIDAHSNTLEIVTTRELLEQKIKSMAWATASKRYILDCMSKYALSTQNRRSINSLYTLYRDVGKTLTVRGTFRNVATRLIRHSTYSIYDMSFRRIHSISWPKCVYTDEHTNTVMDYLRSSRVFTTDCESPNIKLNRRHGGGSGGTPREID